MQVAVTGATGFLGRYVVDQLAASGHQLRCWFRAASDRGDFEAVASAVEWVPGELGDERASANLVRGCDAVVHCGLWRPGRQFRGGEGNVTRFVQTNVLGTLQLIEAARAAEVERFVFISTCAVHEVILADRPLDEAHPLWPASHYGAHKAALEKFVHSYGYGDQYAICALRPTGIYGVARPVDESKWYDLVRAVVAGKEVTCRGGGKEVHAADVARAVELVLSADGVAGQVYNCYDRYIAEFEVATLARQIAGSGGQIVGEPTTPKHQIATGKIRQLGLQFGGQERLEQTVRQLVAACG